MSTEPARYRTDQTYRWNFEHAPDPVPSDVPQWDHDSTFVGLPATGPLGVAAGPLLNGRWILYYASLGFDVLTYKTVRSGQRDCYPLPNLVHVPDRDALHQGDDFVASESNSASWAVSFGMPSSEPAVWRDDIRATRDQLDPEKRLSVSVVGTVQEGWSIEQLAADYAICARWAVESGADAIEANLSCPNVTTCDGQLYQQPAQAKIVAQAIRDEIGAVPLILKIGHVVEESSASELLGSIDGLVTGIAMTNSVAGRVRKANGEWLFDGQPRGICGGATFNASLAQVKMFARLVRQQNHNVRLIGVGGASTAQQVLRYLDAGAECVHLATAAMLDPNVAITIKKDAASSVGSVHDRA